MTPTKTKPVIPPEAEERLKGKKLIGVSGTVSFGLDDPVNELKLYFEGGYYIEVQVLGLPQVGWER